MNGFKYSQAITAQCTDGVSWGASPLLTLLMQWLVHTTLSCCESWRVSGPEKKRVHSRHDIILLWPLKLCR